MSDLEYKIRPMTLDDYDEVYALWMQIHGFGIRSIDDSREGVERFLKRNPTTSMVAVAECVHENYRKHGIGKSMAVACMRALQEEKINKVCLIAFKSNELGNHFWKEAGWDFREDLNYYDFTLNEANITKFNQ